MRRSGSDGSLRPPVAKARTPKKKEVEVVEDGTAPVPETIDSLDDAASMSGVTALHHLPKEVHHLPQARKWIMVLNLENGQWDAKLGNSKYHAKNFLKGEHEKAVAQNRAMDSDALELKQRIYLSRAGRMLQERP